MGKLIPGVLKDSSMWVVENFVNYDSNTFMVAFIQISHRTTAYALFFIGLAFVWTVFKRSVKAVQNSIAIVNKYVDNTK
jgi:hypothetical protein